MPLQLESTRNIVYVESSGSEAEIPPQGRFDDATVKNMLESESICQKLTAFLKDEVLSSVITIDGTAVSEADGGFFQTFLVDSIDFYLCLGFVPFRLRKISHAGTEHILPFVIPHDQIEFELEDMNYDDFAPNVTVDFVRNFAAEKKNKKPRIYVYTFCGANRPRGVLEGALVEYRRLCMARGYQKDFLDLNRSSLLFLQRQKAAEQVGDYGKVNVNQILSVSDQFRVQMDSSIRDDSDLVAEKEKTRQIKEDVESQANSNPALQRFCANVSLPENSTGHLFHFRPPAINVHEFAEDFHGAVMNCLHLPAGWNGEARIRSRKRDADDVGTQRAREPDNDAAAKSSARVLAELSKMMSFILSLMRDKENHKKIYESEASAKRDASRNNKTVNVLNLYACPTHVVKLQKPTVTDVSFLLDMYSKHIISHGQFAESFSHATGMPVDPALKRLRLTEYDSKIQELKTKPAKTV